ncbi:MAG: hypothetical protein DI555_06990 [Novosphingobium pentaromativorans]|uniref:Uncharacterized protein n=1 Tax=Novosphingobium pentaromativorans TaxID=205844 RepID=A0A2W5NZ17_9SPHN|nr:MAG: hypothetical protein DI555_06990 [Novosphingobium pentaromativorans]
MSVDPVFRNVTQIEDGAASRYIRNSILGYLGDHPDTDFQKGYLAAMVDLYTEVLNRDPDDRIKAAAKLVYPDGI